jgi:hypothetical protein
MAEKRELRTLGELLYWSYSNLAMAHAAIEDQADRYRKIHFIIRSRLFKGLCTGSMKVGSLIDDERLKMQLPQACVYCGATESLSLDHLIPKFVGGADTGDNVVWACLSCNSSKGKKDLLDWMQRKGQFPPLMLLRRYLKLAIEYCDEYSLLNVDINRCADVPFNVNCIPRKYPSPSELILWVLEPGEDL